MGWMTKVKPEEKPEEVPLAGKFTTSGTIVPTYTVYSVGDIVNGLILLGPFYDDLGNKKQHSLLWAEPTTIFANAHKNMKTHIAFLGTHTPVLTSYQKYSLSGWIDDAVLALVP